jgi:hypothetical protein
MSARKINSRALPVEVQAWLKVLERETRRLSARRRLKAGEDANALDTLEETLDLLLAFFLETDEPARRALSRAVAPYSNWLVLDYAHRQAVRAVRENQPRRVELGMAALVAEDAHVDYRDTRCR